MFLLCPTVIYIPLYFMDEVRFIFDCDLCPVVICVRLSFMRGYDFEEGVVLN